jgi:pyrroline-5-carboxylate reductase
MFAQEFNAGSMPLPDLISGSDIVILAVKPNQVMEVLEQTQQHWSEKNLIISIAAGISTRSIEEKIPNIPVVRTMPNTPCLAGMGVVAVSGEALRKPAT